MFSASDALDVSVVIPAYDEAESLPELVRELRAILGGLDGSWEVLVDAYTGDVLASVSVYLPEIRFRPMIYRVD